MGEGSEISVCEVRNGFRHRWPGATSQRSMTCSETIMTASSEIYNEACGYCGGCRSEREVFKEERHVDSQLAGLPERRGWDIVWCTSA